MVDQKDTLTPPTNSSTTHFSATPEGQLFHPLIAKWFQENFPGPTDIQSQSWPQIAANNHVLISAPTGSGKTLTAFLWAINQLVTGVYPSGYTSVLYISPLKALNNDIYNNLRKPLQELKAVFAAAGEEFPNIRVNTRSGDTPADERRQMVRRPPEILITTPESLNLLLSSQSGLSLLQGLQTVILDEIHSLLDNKRGAYLNLAMERLVLYSGEFQRIALSATINPMQAAADFVAGYHIAPEHYGIDHSDNYHRRDIKILQSHIDKTYDIKISYPETLQQLAEDKHLWDALAEELLVRIEKNRSTLIFVNSRILCEKIANRINAAAESTVAYAHHGSLSKEIRKAVESRLKAGELAAIVATSSLEMGIDIGSLDEVLLVQTSGSIASAIQRVGRAGHQVGEVSRSTLFPTHPQDFLETAVLAKAIQDRDLEPITPIENPLDVLCQCLISMVAMDDWNLDELYGFIKSSQVYHQLSRTLFDLVLNMLAGRYSDNRIKELKPRISLDREHNRARIRPGALLTLYMSGGVIPDRGYYQLRHQDSNSKIGELDEEFVWEASVGQVFTLGTQHWKITRITHNDVFVLPSPSNPLLPPFWKAESINRNFHFSEKISQFLAVAESASAKELQRTLCQDYQMESSAVDALSQYLSSQKEHLNCPLPHRYHIVIEIIDSFLGFSQAKQVVIHTFWGARVNRPLALALEGAWSEKHNEKIELYVSNEAIVVQLPEGFKPEEILDLVTPVNLEEKLRLRLEGSGFFNARFRECSGRALLLSKGKFNERRPLWLSRLNSQKLFDVVQKYSDFPILLETWRTCLQDEFDIPNLTLVLDEWQSGKISQTLVHTATPSPMAQNISWEQINLYMYKDDSPQGNQKPSQLNTTLLNDILYQGQVIPAIPELIAQVFDQKVKRLAPGYGPESAEEITDWISDRSFIPFNEWESLISNARLQDQEAILKKAAKPVKVISFAAQHWVCLDDDVLWIAEGLNTILQASSAKNKMIKSASISAKKPFTPPKRNSTVNLDDTNSIEPLEQESSAFTLLWNYLQYSGPVTTTKLSEIFQCSESYLQELLNDKVADRELVYGSLIEDQDTPYYCYTAHFETLLYQARNQKKQAASETFITKPLATLPLFLYEWQQQQLNSSQDRDEQLMNGLAQLQGYFASPKLWETDFLPSRMNEYQMRDLDHVFQSTDLCWIGNTEKKTAFCYQSDLDLIPTQIRAEEDDSPLKDLFSDHYARYEYQALLELSQLPTDTVLTWLWQEVWQRQLSNDHYGALRRGIETQFKTENAATALTQGRGSKARMSRRALQRGFNQWKRTVEYPGNWFALSPNEDSLDALAQSDLIKDKARQLFQRYGVLYREILQKEMAGFRWADIFKALRIMELSREIISGYFFADIPGLQFANHEAFRKLQKDLEDKPIFWLNACDPISLCGVALPELKVNLPKRMESNHVVYEGMDLVMISESQGKHLTFNVAVDHPKMGEILGVLKHLLYRDFQPLKQVRIQTINGESARKSIYLDALETSFDVTRSPNEVCLLKSF